MARLTPPLLLRSSNPFAIAAAPTRWSEEAARRRGRRAPLGWWSRISSVFPPNLRWITAESSCADYPSDSPRGRPVRREQNPTQIWLPPSKFEDGRRVCLFVAWQNCKDLGHLVQYQPLLNTQNHSILINQSSIANLDWWGMNLLVRSDSQGPQPRSFSGQCNGFWNFSSVSFNLYPRIS